MLGIADGVAVDLKAAAYGARFLAPAAMNGIKRQQVGGGGSVTAVVIDVHQFDAGPSPKGTKDQATDSPKAVDAYLQGLYELSKPISLNQ